MASARTYLDHNASAPLRPEAWTAMLDALALVGNASSVHAEGRRLRGVIEAAREAVAALVGARPAEVVFTSGATEANVAVLRTGFATAIRAGIEHDSVLAPITASQAEVLALPCTRAGVVDVKAAAAVITAAQGRPGRVLVALQAANNETGAIQPVAEIAALLRAHDPDRRRVHMHCDAVQACGRIAVDMATLGVDTLALSGHKLGGPKGIGALVIRDGADVPAWMIGGGQERGRRAGTENVAAIAGFGAAARVAHDRLTHDSGAAIARMAALRDRLEAAARLATPHMVVIAADAPRLPNTSALAVPGRPADITLIRLDLAGVAVSAGAACSSGKVGRSHVLDAMGLNADTAGGAIRISLGPETTEADVDRFLAAWRQIHDADRSRSHDGDPSGIKQTMHSERSRTIASATGG